MQANDHTFRRGISRIPVVLLTVVALALFLAVLARCCVKSASQLDLKSRMWAFQTCLWQLMVRQELPENATYDTNGIPACSWRFACDFNVNPGGAWPVNVVDTTVPWDSMTLARFHDVMPTEYCFSGTTETNVMAVVGEGTAFEKGKRFQHRDLPGNLVLILEVHGTGVHWMAPRDLTVKDLADIQSGADSPISLGTSGQGFLVGFLDGEVWMLANEVPKERLLMFCSREGARVHDREKMLSDFRLARRRHLYRGRESRY